MRRYANAVYAIQGGYTLSAEHVGWAFRQDAGSATRKVVLVALADRCNKDTLKCCPKVATLVEDCNLGDRAVRNALKQLCEMGLIARERRRRKDGSLSGYDYVFPNVSFGASPPAPDAASPPAPDAAHEPEVNLEPNTLAATPRERRPADDVWDMLTHMFGEPTTESAKSQRGKLVRSLAAAGATPKLMSDRANMWPEYWPEVPLTAAALEKHWDTLGRRPLRRR
jgi:hypothetical protein